MLHERKYHLSKIKVAFCTNFFMAPSGKFGTFCTPALHSCKKVPKFHSAAIKKIRAKKYYFYFFSRNSYFPSNFFRDFPNNKEFKKSPRKIRNNLARIES